MKFFTAGGHDRETQREVNVALSRNVRLLLLFYENRELTLASLHIFDLEYLQGKSHTPPGAIRT